MFSTQVTGMSISIMNGNASHPCCDSRLNLLDDRYDQQLQDVRLCLARYSEVDYENEYPYIRSCNTRGAAQCEQVSCVDSIVRKCPGN